MAQVVFGGSLEFNRMSSGEQHPNTVQYLRNQMVNLSNYVGTTATAWSQRAVASYEQFSSDNAIRTANAALRRVTSYFQTDTIKSLYDIGDFQNAPRTMQRFLMAEPETRAEYHAQRNDGYSGYYVDMEPGSIGAQHYDYRRVMQGLIVDVPATPDDPEPSWMATVYLDELHEGDRELTLLEQVTITSSWERMRFLMGTGLEDPTSPTGGML